MDVAHEQHHVGRSRRRHRRRTGAEGGELDGAIQLLVRQDAGLQGVVDGDLGRVGVRPLEEARQIERAAAPIQIGRQDFRIPAAAGPEVDHRHLRLQAEETQGLDRMAPGVPRLVVRRAP